jgi:hypothetical protein
MGTGLQHIAHGYVSHNITFLIWVKPPHIPEFPTSANETAQIYGQIRLFQHPETGCDACATLFMEPTSDPFFNSQLQARLNEHLPPARALYHNGNAT